MGGIRLRVTVRSITLRSIDAIRVTDTRGGMPMRFARRFDCGNSLNKRLVLWHGGSPVAFSPESAGLPPQVSKRRRAGRRPPRL